MLENYSRINPFPNTEEVCSGICNQILGVCGERFRNLFSEEENLRILYTGHWTNSEAILNITLSKKCPNASTSNFDHNTDWDTAAHAN